LNPAALPAGTLTVIDELGEAGSATWNGVAEVRLDPSRAPASVFSVVAT
jgi:hypothetical protein